MTGLRDHLLTAETDFFPTDMLLKGNPETALKYELLKLLIKDEKLAELVIAISERNADTEFFVDGINEANNKYLAAKYNHEGDLVWVYKELKAALSVWDQSNEILGGVEAKDVLYRIVATLHEKIEEFE